MTATPSSSLRKRWQEGLRGSYPVHEVTNQIRLRHVLSEYKPAILLLDSDVIRHRGIRQVTSLVQASSATRVIYFTDDSDDYEAIAVLKSGAAGYCLKELTAASLKKVIEAVKRGEIWAERRLLSLFIKGSLSAKSTKPLPSVTFVNRVPLSPRERDIATMIGTGQQNKSISTCLSISEKTVKAHLTSIFKKLGVSSRTQLALCVRKNEFPPLSSGPFQNSDDVSSTLH